MSDSFVEGEDYPFQSFDCDEVLYEDEASLAAQKAFGIKYLFPWQHLVINNILDAANRWQENGSTDGIEESEQNDEVCRGRQIVLLPTGAGKSLCFLTPALLLNGATLVIYPLLALMADQKRRMDEGGLGCVVFKGGQTEDERKENIRSVKDGKSRVIIANPEVLQNKELVAELKKCKIAHIAIDESHCVSEWGDSFRPVYLTLGGIISELGVKVVTAFTATASPPVLSRIGEVLFNNDYHLVQGASDRANIHYEVRYAYAKKKAVLHACVESKKPLIVFCSSRRRTEETARLINACFGFQIAKFYHAGMTNEEKLSVEKWFFASDDGILTATCAYGMGMDKGNIFTVIHLDSPEHIENFIQEAGRAGRKGDSVKSILIWSHQDQRKWLCAPPLSREKVMGDFANTKNCRRDFLLNYLSGESAVCSGCDICDAKKEGRTVNYNAGDAEFAFKFIKRYRRLLKREEAVQALTQKFNEKDAEFYTQNVWEARDVQEILKQLFDEKRIKKTGGLWENHLDIIKKKNKKRHLSLKTIHHLHLLRLQFRHFLVQLEQVRQQLS
jgi:ATP-dependent DNA helicase RecQ